jgi:chemotaxis protein methyltransferase CheR
VTGGFGWQVRETKMPSVDDQLSERDFCRLKDLIGSACGLALVPSKRIMVETRLRKRIRALGFDTFSAYCRYLDSPAGRSQEWPNLIDAITTHKTDFFREPAHFDFLIDQAVPELARRSGIGHLHPLQVWSAACSTGEEPYTLAMVLSRHARALAPRVYRFRIHATDISRGVLETAQLGIYPEPVVRPVPDDLRRLYVLRSKNRDRAVVRMAPELRASVTFRQLNLMDADYGFEEPFHVVLCRNVMIYFDRPTQQMVLNRISSNLHSGGYLLMGHSESLNGLDVPLVQVAPTVYRRIHG